MKIYWEIGNLHLPSYTCMALIGFVISIFVLFHMARKNGMTKKELLCQMGYGAVFSLLFAKLFYALAFLPVLMKNFFLKPEEKVHPDILAGYVFYGGLIGLFLGIWFYNRMMRHAVLPYLDMAVTVVPLFHGFGRIGCYLAGCCYGREYYGPGAMQYPANAFQPGIENVTRFPVQVVESGYNFLLFFLIQWMAQKKQRPGRLFGFYLMAYPAARFLLEFLRGDEIRGIFTIGKISLSFSQCISLILFGIGCKYYHNLERENEKEAWRID